MGLFNNKNPNEVNYQGGKKHWADVIKNTGPGDLLIWRQPEEDFNTNSTLIVMPGESAIFVKGGQIVQVFESGRYKLSTENYPFISRLRNAFTGGISTFNCVVYFVKQADSMEIYWGTDSPIQLRDKVENIRTEAKVRGAYKVRIVNPAKFLEKLVGSNVKSMGQTELNKYFQMEFQGKIKAAVAKFLNSLEQELIGIDAYLEDLSQQIEPYIDEAVGDYGLKCVRFSLSGMDVDTSKYDELDSADREYYKKVRGDVMVDRARLDALGDAWGRVQADKRISEIAKNPGSGGLANMGAGIGMGIGAMGMVGNMVQSAYGSMGGGYAPGQPGAPGQFGPQGGPSRFTQQQPGAGAQQSGAGAQQAPQVPAAQQEDVFAAMEKLNKMYAAGFLTEEEYKAKKAEILSRM